MPKKNLDGENCILVETALNRRNVIQILRDNQIIIEKLYLLEGITSYFVSFRYFHDQRAIDRFDFTWIHT